MGCSQAGNPQSWDSRGQQRAAQLRRCTMRCLYLEAVAFTPRRRNRAILFGHEASAHMPVKINRIAPPLADFGWNHCEVTPRQHPPPRVVAEVLTSPCWSTRAYVPSIDLQIFPATQPHPCASPVLTSARRSTMPLALQLAASLPRP